MDIQYNKLFPYPVLSQYSDDYLNCEFESNIVTKLDGYNLEITATTINTNPEVKKLIDDGLAEHILHIECPQTSYRDAIKFESDAIKTTISSKKINGRITICTFVITKEKITGFSSQFLNKDYSGLFFDFDKSSIIAIAKQYDLNITKEQEDFARIPSIFSVIKRSGSTDRSIKVDLGNQKINIILPESQFIDYRKLINKNALQTATHSMLILPALIHVFNEIKVSGIEPFENLNWFKALTKALKKLNIELDEDTIMELVPFKTSQDLIDMPIERGFISLSNLYDLEDSEI